MNEQTDSTSIDPYQADAINDMIRGGYAAKYVPVGYRTANSHEKDARRIAHDLKLPTEEAIEIAAPALAALIEGPCWLVPVPASTSSLCANLALARAIAERVSGARVKCAVARARPVESSYSRRSRGLFGLTIEEHAIIRSAGPMQALPAYFVDNVVTTGTTIEACRRALGWGNGLVYADASTPRRVFRSY
jgi:predicted amidophosphoribosyltransferase